MYKAITHLSHFITPETSGIVWLTDEALNYESPGVYEFNYLLDGLLVKAIEENAERNEQRNFFLGENFGAPFFIGHVVVKDKSDIDVIQNHFKLANSFIKENSIIYIFNRSKNTANINILKVLSRQHKNIEFKNLNI